MKKLLSLITLFIALNTYSQSVFGYWYGTGNIKSATSTNNYLVEIILQPEKGHVKGVLNYFFKNIYRSLRVKGTYNAATRELILYNIPVTYHGSASSMEVDCIMNLWGKLMVAKKGSSLTGRFISTPDYKYLCADINFTLTFNAGISKKDSVLQAIRMFKETNQVWKPSLEDSLVAVNVIQRKVINYVVEDKFKERENVISDEIEVNTDTVKVDIYDNGEVDGDSISVFFNNQLLIFSQLLSSKAIHFNLALDDTKEVNELSMFANNLGSIPPNTALMIVNDGKKKYEIRLTSNLQTNGTIRIRRKRETGSASLK
jgi:hypothetical protein